MNNNRNNNNRRRGRGNRNHQNSGGGNQLNRIDSRARGNAPQMLDKYKKLAQDAQHHGDRVQMEQYLQFADHYHRVLADNKARQDEARAKRDGGRNEDRDQANDDSDDGDEGENRRRNSRRPRGRRDNNDNNQSEGETGVEGGSADADSGSEETPEPKQRRARKPRGEPKGEVRTPKPRARKPREPRSNKADGNDGASIDSAVLPPAIGGDERSDGDGDSSVEAVG